MVQELHWLTYDSSIGEFYRHPVGHDALAKILLQLVLAFGGGNKAEAC